MGEWLDMGEWFGHGWTVFVNGEQFSYGWTVWSKVNGLVMSERFSQVQRFDHGWKVWSHEKGLFMDEWFWPQV